MDSTISNKISEVHLLPLYGGTDLCQSEKTLNSLPEPSPRLYIMGNYAQFNISSIESPFWTPLTPYSFF